ncbi:MAG: hypothetical protein CMK71_11665 [Pseudomonadaceae bacterium]|nr:hypothetical protein [Pseudomonadaceae bacterium]
MPDATRNARYRFPLHVHISVLFTLLLLSTGIVLGIYNYYQTSKIILSNSDEMFGLVSNQVNADLDHTYRPIRNLVGMLALDMRNKGKDHQERMALLPVFAKALHDNPKLASLYLGYGNGDFFMVRPLRTDALKERFDAPAEAVYQVWSINRINSGTAVSEYLFYNENLEQLGTRQNLKEAYNPISRPWYSHALNITGQYTTAPYLFFSTGDVGITVAQHAADNIVISADITLASLSATLASHKITPSTQAVMYSPDGLVVAYPDVSRLTNPQDRTQLTPIANLAPVLADFQKMKLDKDFVGAMEIKGRRWQVAYRTLPAAGPNGLRLALLAPEDELLADAYRIRWQGAVLTIAILLLCIPIGWLMSRILVRPLNGLVNEAEAIRRFNFSHPATGRSPVLEVDELAVSMGRMKDTIFSFLEITASLSAETRFDKLLERVLQETVGISQAHGGVLYLTNADGSSLLPYGVFLNGQKQDVNEHHMPSYSMDGENMPTWLKEPALGGKSSAVSIGFDQAGEFKDLLTTLETPRAQMVVTGLHNRQGATVGTLLLLHREDGISADPNILSPARVAFVEAVSGVAALCIESQRLLERQKNLLDSFIQLMAGAIDAKSPYTGGHCQRVPEITLMLARAAAQSDAPPFKDYNPTDEEWEALHIGAWLHDCGKVTTPEYVVDKATKLETLYDRIHEVRCRFEILKRDAWISYWQNCAQGGDATSLANTRDALLAKLDEEFAFVAKSNLGGEAMADEDIARLRQIGQRTWLRTLDDRLGVSWEESKRQERSPPPTLPVLEPLLADKPEHLFERPASELIEEDNRWGFRLDVPAYKFNRGELHNLGVTRGTLTAEERYIINHHIVQTIIMLDHLPFPPHLQNVAEIAGGHHEKMDGTGYPKRLSKEQMSLPARMMAIADIFEALTAVDRPYKKGKLLSESLNIMAGMCRGAHIDTDLFGLFISSRVYRRYAERFMQPEQIDTVDESALLAKAGFSVES